MSVLNRNIFRTLLLGAALLTGTAALADPGSAKRGTQSGLHSVS